MNGNLGYEPSIEGKDDQRSLPRFLEEEPRYVVGNGTFKKVPLLTGVTRDETANSIDIKNIEKIFSTATKFLDSVANSLKKHGLGNAVNTLLPGFGMHIPFFLLRPIFFFQIIFSDRFVLQKRFYHSPNI